MGCNASKITDSNNIILSDFYDDNDTDLKQMKEFEIVEDPTKMLQMMANTTTNMGTTTTSKENKRRSNNSNKIFSISYPRRPRRHISSGANNNNKSKGKSSSSSAAARQTKTFGLGAEKYVYEKTPRSEGVDGILINLEEN